MPTAPLAWARHASYLARPSALPAARISGERAVDQRRARARAAISDAVSQRLRPTRPRMRTLVARPGGRMTWESLPTPRLEGPAGAIVRPVAVATCDMDCVIAQGKSPFPMPLCFGHECVAEVLEVGDEVQHFAPGDVVVVPFQINCGACAACLAGRTSNCTSVPPISMYGFGVIGGHWGGAIADQLAVPFADGMLVRLPEGISPAAAASVADNVSDAHRHIAPHLPGLLAQDADTEVLIMGAMRRRHAYTASVLLYTGLIAQTYGGQQVTLADARPNVRSLATALGMTALDPKNLTGPPSSRLVVDLSGSARGTRRALERTAADGFCSSAGGIHSTVRMPLSTMYGRNVTLSVARCHARAEIPKVLDLMAADRLHPEAVTTVVAPMDDAVEVMTEHVRAQHAKTIVVAN